MLRIQIQTQNFTIIKTKNQINNLPSKIRMGMGMGGKMNGYGGGNEREGEKEKGSSSEGERDRGGEESMAGLSLVGVVAGLGWAGLCSSTPAGLCVCVCVNVRGRVRDREKMRQFYE